MTDKRFTFVEMMLGYMGTYIKDEGKRIRTINEVVDLLNELNDENQELKELINYKNKTQQESLTKMQEAQKERADIKHTIKTMMETERTHIGYNTLKQLWMAIQ